MRALLWLQAGTGKSLLLRRIQYWLEETFDLEEWAVTAPTGCAAVNIGGVTLHSLAGVAFAFICLFDYMLHDNNTKNAMPTNIDT